MFGNADCCTHICCMPRSFAWRQRLVWKSFTKLTKPTHRRIIQSGCWLEKVFVGRLLVRTMNTCIKSTVATRLSSINKRLPHKRDSSAKLSRTLSSHDCKMMLARQPRSPVRDAPFQGRRNLHVGHTIVCTLAVFLKVSSLD